MSADSLKNSFPVMLLNKVYIFISTDLSLNHFPPFLPFMCFVGVTKFKSAVPHKLLFIYGWLSFINIYRRVGRKSAFPKVFIFVWLTQTFAHNWTKMLINGAHSVNFCRNIEQGWWSLLYIISFKSGEQITLSPTFMDAKQDLLLPSHSGIFIAHRSFSYSIL